MAKRIWNISEREKRVNWCSSKMAVLCSISRLWRCLCEADKSTMEGEHRKIEVKAIDMLLEVLNLLTLMGCSDIELMIKERVNEREKQCV